MTILYRVTHRFLDMNFLKGTHALGFDASHLVGFVLGMAAMLVAILCDPFVSVLLFAAAGFFFLALMGWRRLFERTRKQLLNRERHYRDFFQNAIEGIFRTSPDGHYIAVNKALARIYGYTSPEELLNGLTDIASQLYTDPARRAEFKRIMAADDKVTDFVSEIRRHDGSKIWITENARAVRDWAGHIVCYEGTVVDVTEKFEAQRMMQQALREAEEANRAKSAFLATMSHELRTPLNAIIGFSEILKDEMLGAMSPPAYRDYAGDIHISGVRLLAIINDILDASRLEGSTIVIDPVPNALDALISDAIVLARNLTGDKHEISVHLAPQLPEFLVDGKRFCQCIAKVLTNAMKFTPEGGEIAVSAQCGEDGGLRLSVTDTGIGMDPEKVAAALQPFHQLDGSLARRFGGTGLGLSITKALLALHGGTLEIQSAIGKGTTVTLLLPPSQTLAPVSSAASAAVHGK